MASRTTRRSSRRGGSTRVKSSTNSWVRAPPTNSVRGAQALDLASDRDALADDGRQLERAWPRRARRTTTARVRPLEVRRDECPGLGRRCRQRQQCRASPTWSRPPPRASRRPCRRWPRRAPSLTRGEALPRRLMAPSTRTCSAPSACRRVDRAAQLRERGGPADLDLALAAGAADDHAAQRRVERQLLEHLHGVARAVERPLGGGHQRAGRRRDARLGQPGEVVGALAVEAERREAEQLRAVGHERVDDGRLAGVLDQADDGERPAARSRR